MDLNTKGMLNSNFLCKCVCQCTSALKIYDLYTSILMFVVFTAMHTQIQQQNKKHTEPNIVKNRNTKPK